ncbi:MAG: His/Glu/Gln/Arg/opine family amino acid ABC transporter permease subunit [Gammaproteobacteria bacterium]|jgi:His/Glu/Gln/Arg/opine family amino acid ABC transporter permease subunit
MLPTETYFSGFTLSDLWYMGEAALRSLWISVLAIAIGSFAGIFLGWTLSVSKRVGAFTIAPILDIFRSVPLIIQLVLFFNFVPLIGIRLGPFGAGLIILSVYTAANVAYVARGGIEAVGQPMRRAARSLGMTYWQDMRYVVWPIGLRAVFPAWVGVALGVMKDSALVSVLGYVELLKASQILMTRTQEIILILSIAGAFYFALSYPISLYASRLEQRWKQ